MKTLTAQGRRVLFVLLSTFVSLFFTSFNASAQVVSGCTDPNACNFNPLAAVDDGSCVYGNCEFLAVNDVLCVQLGELPIGNVVDNDYISAGIEYQVFPQSDDPCMFIDPSGNIRWYNGENPSDDCCGLHYLSYIIQSGNNVSEAFVKVTVKCNKPDCALVNLEDYSDQGQGGDYLPVEPSCVYACENSVATVFVPYTLGYSYDWTVIGGVFAPGSNDAEISVTWGPAGGGFISLVITDTNGQETNMDVCVTILEGPDASFTAPSYVCNDATITFNNTSTNATSYQWDFGDGNYSDMEDPTHTYNAPGIYTVTLTATVQNFDAEGNPLCCCTDTFAMDIEVDELPSPSIFWISTLCEGDSSCYWTDAICGTYNWTVLDANGDPVLTWTGNGNDTICVNWPIPSGGFGTILLEVPGCAGYCSSPAEVTVPILPANGTIEGPAMVCEGDVATYSLPKWISASYLWTVTGGMILGSDSGHVVTVHWGPAGVGTIHVDYHSDFLAGLPGHEFPDCYGSADFTVDIRPKFSLTNFGAAVVCVNSSSIIGATSIPYGSYSWTVSPAQPFSGDGTDQITINWNTTGIYQITAVPNDPNIYCNNTQTIVVRVVGVPPADGIQGATDVCLNQPYTYSVISSTPGVYHYWVANNGIVNPAFGTSTQVTWLGGGPMTLEVYQYQVNAPGCGSAPINIVVNPIELIGPLDIDGPTSCSNTLQPYTLSPAQHPSAIINWTVSPDSAGSVVGGQGTQSIQVQWNNYSGLATLNVTVEVCGTTYPYGESFMVNMPVVPVITQIGVLCPGVPATLATTAPFSGYSWSTGDNTSSATIYTAGDYSVTTTDSNGCQATDYYEANNVPGPVAAISSPDNLTICLPGPAVVNIVAQTNLSYEFDWYCNGNLLALPPTTSAITHGFIGSPSVTPYYVVVTDTNTGCQATSNTLLVEEEFCGGSCAPEPYTLSISGVNQSPNCNIVDFNYTATNFTPQTWYFGDGYTSSSPNPSHAYTTAGCYNVDLVGLVPEQGNPGFFCSASADVGVCVPIAAFFDLDYLGCADVQFNDLSTFIAGPGNDINYWEWDFGFGGPLDYTPSPSVTFPGGGFYTVTLTVANSNGCIATYSDVVFVDSVGIPSISAPLSACENEPVSLSASASGAVSYKWDFGDGSTFVGANPQHTWIDPGTFTITVTAYNQDGCTETRTATIIIYPEVPDGNITASSLVICQGNFATLCAPAGYSYEWQPGLETTQCISVPAGTYSVTLTDANGCSRDLDAVTIEEVPLPQAVITGNPVICNAGCATLFALYGVGYTYQWYTGLGAPIPGEVSQSLTVCDFGLDPNGYVVEVTDANGCKAISTPFTVSVKPSPIVDILVSPDFCEGTPSTLTVDPDLSPGVSYAWSTGQTGTSIVVTTAGTYTVIATNNDTGCSASDAVTINPMPDLCIVPVGCYEACNPDTICGPPGLTSYEWLFNGTTIPGETGQCLEVTVSGTYNLVGTNEFGCSDTSGVLVLQLIDCPDDICDEVVLDYAFVTDADGNVDSCCVDLSYTLGSFPIIGVKVHTVDADIQINSYDPLLYPQTILADAVSLANAVPGWYLPTGTLNNFFSFCLTNAVNYPQQVIVDWYDTDAHVACSDTIIFNCPVEPDCLYLQSDSIYCKGVETTYEFTVCNPADADFNIGYIVINPTNPPGIMLSAGSFDITASPILPGTCQTFVIALSGAGIAGQTFCYQMIGHEQNPNLVPNGLCCSLDTTYCIEIPICDPCGYVHVESVLPSDEADCCYAIDLYNGFASSFFDEIALSVISPLTTFTINNPFGSGWFTSGYTGTEASFIPDALLGGFVPFGNFSIPEICVETNVAPYQQIEIKWMKDGSIFCRDTIEVFCKPDCGYITEEQIFCDPAAGIWVFNGFITNTSDFVVSEAVISFSDPGMNIYNTTIPVGPMNPGDVYGPISINIGAPAVSGQALCFTVTLHEINADGIYLNCCNFTHCITLPECQFDVPCLCDESFYSAVQEGITCVSDPFNMLTIHLSLTGAGVLQECDQVRWRWGDGTTTMVAQGNETVSHTYSLPGSFTVCAKIYRLDDNGNSCSSIVCKPIIFSDPMDPDMIRIAPNPNNGQFSVQLPAELHDLRVDLSVVDNTGRPVFDQTYEDLSKKALLFLDLSDRAKGMYFLRFTVGDQTVVKRVVVQ